MGSKELYSVFVGHLPPETTKMEFEHIFRNCGAIGDLNIVQTGKPFNYGFVRYREIDSVIQAMKELNKWKVRGKAIVVDMAKDTRERLEREKLQIGNRLIKESKRPVEGSQTPSMKPSEFIDDVMYLSRLKENCASLNFEVSKQKVGLIEKGNKQLREMDIEKVLDYVARAEKGRPKTIAGEVSEQPSLESVKEKLLKSDDVSETDARVRTDTFMSVLSGVMETISTFVGDSNTCAKKQQKNQDLSNSVSKQSKDLISEYSERSCLSESSSGLFSQGESDGCDDFSVQKPVARGSFEKPVLSHRYGASSRTVNDPDSDSSSLSSDDQDQRNGDSGVELDSSACASSNKKSKELSLSRQSSDEMPSLESGEILLKKLQSSSGTFKSNLPMESGNNMLENETAFLSTSLSPEPGEEQGVRLKRQAKSDGDLVCSKQTSIVSSSDSEDQNFMHWVINRLKESETGKNSDETVEEKGATGGMLSPRDKMVASSQFQKYYMKAILGRGRGINPPKSQTDDYWVRGGRWGRGYY